MPRVGDRVDTPQGEGIVTEVSGYSVYVRLDGDSHETVFGDTEVTVKS